MLGLNHRLRKVPVIRSTTKLHSAISPSMKDQWSGKTLRICVLLSVARPVRSSAHVTRPPSFDGLLTVAALVPLEFVELMKNPVPRS